MNLELNRKRKNARVGKKSSSWCEYVRSVFLAYVQRFPGLAKGTEYPFYFQRELHISSINTYITRLIRERYLERREDGELILTEQGKQSIVPVHLRFFHESTPMISFEEFWSEWAQQENPASFEQVLLGIYVRRIDMLSVEQRYQEIADIHLELGKLYEAIEQPETALTHYLTVLRYDASGLDYREVLAAFQKKKTSRQLTEEYFFGVCIRPSAVSAVRRLKEYYSSELLNELFGAWRLEFDLCGAEEFAALIEELQNGTYNYSGWKQYFKEQYLKAVFCIAH